MRPRICVLADTPNWAWYRKGEQYVRYLSDEFDVRLHHQKGNMPSDWFEFDLVHLFEVSQTGHVDPLYRGRGRLVAGLTAHVWQTWGEARMREWASRCDALHGNSPMLVDELKQFHTHVHYLPNGVDAKFWQRTTPRRDALTACHVGKPNPRKGGHMIIEACDNLGLPLLVCQRTSHIAHPPERIRDDFYSPTWMQITMSDMDGTPNCALEAASVGNMQISTRIGNMIEFIDNGHANAPGILIERSTEALEAALAWCQRHVEDVVSMGVEARRTVEREWTWAQQCEHVRAMWREVLV